MTNEYITVANNFTSAPSIVGKSAALSFAKGSARRTVYIPLSRSHFDGNTLKVESWLLTKDLGAVIKNGYKLANANLLIVPSANVSLVPRITPAQTLQTSEGLPVDEIVPTFPQEHKEAIIKKGFFTVVNEDGSHRTFRVKTSPKGQKRTVIGMLTGSNNISDYVWFAFINGGSLQFFFKNKFDKKVMRDYFEVIKGDPTAAGRRFALESKQCCRCGAELTNPVSINNPRGLGPICDGMPNAFR